MANGSLTDHTIEKIKNVHKDVRDKRRDKDIPTLYDLVELQSGLLIQIQLLGCAAGCRDDMTPRFGWPAAVTAVTLVIAVLGILLRVL